MPNDDPSPVVQGANPQNDTDVNHAQPSIPPDTPTPPSGGALTTTRAPEFMALPERYQAAVRHIHALESHNARLYEDNCRLVNAVNMLNDRLTFVGAPQNPQVLRFADIQEKLRACESSRAIINRKYHDLLHSTAAGSAHRHLHEELQSLRDAYTALEKEYRLLVDKYAKLKIISQQPQGASRLVPLGRPEFANTPQFRTQEPGRNGHTSPASAISPGPFSPLVDLNGNRRRHSSESVMHQQPFHSAPTPIATNWSAPLPTPPPSAPLPLGQISPAGFPVHAPMPAGSLLIPHHSPIAYDHRTLVGLPAVIQSQHLVQQGASEKLSAATAFQRRRGESADTVNKEPVPCNNETAPTSSTSSPRPQKRPSSETQDSTIPDGDYKKPRIEEEAVHPTTIADTHSVDGTVSQVSNDPHMDAKASQPDLAVRSYQDCVNIIFEKDADVENGVFCGLCLDRHEAKMIPEPPDVLVQPDFDVLVRHCMNEHPTVWEDLRRKA